MAKLPPNVREPNETGERGNGRETNTHSFLIVSIGNDNFCSRLYLSILIHLLNYTKWAKVEKKLHENYSHISKYI